MAINLNKSNDDEQKLSVDSSEKKGINLTKTDNVAASKLNLTKADSSVSSSKDEEKLNETNDSFRDQSAPSNLKNVSHNDRIENGVKKSNISNNRSKILLAVFAMALIGVAIWVLVNKRNIDNNQAEIESVSNKNIQDVVSSDANTNNNQESNIVGNTTAQDSSLVAVNAPPSADKPSEANTTEDLKKGIPSANQNNSIAQNQKSSTSSSLSPSSNSLSESIDEKAMEVISGVFGNGEERRRALGNEYSVIQAKVNEFYRNKIK